MTIGKIWYEATRDEGGARAGTSSSSTRPRPATRCSIWRMPQAAHDTFGAGLVQREAKTGRAICSRIPRRPRCIW